MFPLIDFFFVFFFLLFFLVYARKHNTMQYYNMSWILLCVRVCRQLASNWRMALSDANDEKAIFSPLKLCGFCFLIGNRHFRLTSFKYKTKLQY